MKRRNSFLSLLDVISCALGAGILLAVVFSIIETPIPAPKSSDFIVLEVLAENENEIWGVLAYHSELGLRKVLVPERQVVDQLNSTDRLLRDRGAEVYSVQTGKGYMDESNGERTVSITLVTIEEPVEGSWLLVPFLYDVYLPDYKSNPTDNTKVRFRWKTKENDVGGDKCICSARNGMDQGPITGFLCHGGNDTRMLQDQFEVSYEFVPGGKVASCKDGHGYVGVRI